MVYTARGLFISVDGLFGQVPIMIRALLVSDPPHEGKVKRTLPYLAVKLFRPGQKLRLARG